MKIAKKIFSTDEYRVELNNFKENEQKISIEGLIKEKLIEIKPTENLTLPFLKTEDPWSIETNDLSFQISNEDINNIINQLVSTLRDPFVVAELLKELDDELGAKMQENNLHFNNDNLPAFIISGQGYFVPGAPQPDYFFKKKGRLLDEILLRREMDNEINMEGVTPRFVGFVNSHLANTFVASGHIFTENKQVSTLLLHGSLSHRLALEAIKRGVETDKLNFNYGNGEKLPLKKLLELLVKTNYYYDSGLKYIGKITVSLWSIVLDSVADYTEAKFGENLCNSNNYSFSCRSPFVLNSLILCFGNELGLPNLQYYLLDSHYKAAYQMVYRMKNSIKLPEISNALYYIHCMQDLILAENYGKIGDDLSFTLSVQDARKDPKFISFDHQSPHSGIVKRQNPATNKGEYGMLTDFFKHLSKKSESESSANNSQPMILSMEPLPKGH